MTSRQTGRRIAAMTAAQRRRPVRHSGVRQTARRREEPLRPAERRQLLQLVVCSGIFVLLVAAKLLLPGKMAEINGALSQAMERNMDVQAVFSAVGRAFSGQSDVSSTADEVYRAVFHPDSKEEALETSAQVPDLQEGAALDLLRGYLPAEEMPPAEETVPEAPVPPEEQVATLAYVLYSDQNLPENVSMQQAILDFDYCTPVNGVVSSGFGYRDHPVEGEERFHYGLDLAADSGTEIRCFADGTVTAVGESSSYGKYCIVSHAGGYSTLYAHCSRVTVSSGTAVREGQKLAEVGETGIATGPHLHFELQKDGTYLNPVYYVAAS